MIVRHSAEAGAGLAGEPFDPPAVFPAVSSPSGRDQGEGERPAFTRGDFSSEVTS